VSVSNTAELHDDSGFVEYTGSAIRHGAAPLRIVSVRAGFGNGRVNETWCRSAFSRRIALAVSGSTTKRKFVEVRY